MMKKKSAIRDLEKELSKARLIQQLLLPQSFPTMAGARMAYRYMPVYDLGGDFLDFFYKRNTEELGFVMCDVSGHGIPAALHSAMLKMSLQLWGEYLDDPVGTYNKMRRMLQGKLGDDFVTASLGYVNLRTGLLRCINAGHEPLLIARRDGTVEPVKPDGCIMHELIEPYIVPVEVHIEPGDKLVLFTDGMSEAPGETEDDMLGSDGLERIIAQHHTRGPEEMCTAILDDVLGYAGGRERMMDDVTLLVIEFTGLPDAA